MYRGILKWQYVKGSPKSILINRNVISNEIINVLTCKSNTTDTLGERVFEPTYGAVLEYFLHDPIDIITANNIKTSVYNALSKWIPHIEVLPNDIDVVPYPDKSFYDISVYWRFIFTNKVGSTKFKAYYSGGSQSPVQN